MHADQGLLEAAALLAMMAFCHVAICARLGIPALVGFLLSGIVIGTLARTVILPFNYPFDTVRRRLMLESEKPPAERLYKSGIDCAIKVTKNEGLAGMYKGVMPEIFRGFGGVMVIVLYDRVKVLLDM